MPPSTSSAPAPSQSAAEEATVTRRSARQARERGPTPGPTGASAPAGQAPTAGKPPRAPKAPKAPKPPKPPGAPKGPRGSLLGRLGRRAAPENSPAPDTFPSGSAPVARPHSSSRSTRMRELPQLTLPRVHVPAAITQTGARVLDLMTIRFKPVLV